MSTPCKTVSECFSLATNVTAEWLNGLILFGNGFTTHRFEGKQPFFFVIIAEHFPP